MVKTLSRVQRLVSLTWGFWGIGKRFERLASEKAISARPLIVKVDGRMDVLLVVRKSVEGAGGSWN